MIKEALSVRRLGIQLKPDPRRTITRFFWPGQERGRKIIDRIKQLPDERVGELLEDILEQFEPVNPGLPEILMDHYERVIEQCGLPYDRDFEMRMLIGAYFSMEYAFEATALFNPSMVEAHEQPWREEGSLDFLMSLRTVGEGHISSITFRRGTVKSDGDISIRPATLQVHAFKRHKNRKFDKKHFERNLKDMSDDHEVIDMIMARLSDRFTALMLEQKLEYYEHRCDDKEAFGNLCDLIRLIMDSEYEIIRDTSINVEDMVLFPMSESESQGMEDMRMVRFKDDDGTEYYLGTYTAYNGRQILPQILEITSAHSMVRIMRGGFARNKGMAFFPRRIDGKFAMIGRIDSENMYLLRSDSIDYWDNAVEIIEPKFDWEFIQIGNCGSPILTDAGWLLLTHGVGAMRKYCMGAVLLDLDDPSKIVGRLEGPLMSPIEEERVGYVPNVVYSCGGLVHNDMLVIPYGISDMASGFAIVSLDELLSRLKG